MRLKTQPFRLSEDQEKKYRQFYLGFDIKQTRRGLLLFTIPMVAFIFNDYQFLGFSSIFIATVLLRLCLLVFLSFTFSYLGKVKNYLVYDKLVTITSIVILFGSGIIHTTRPPNFILHVLMASISLFVLYLVIYN